MYYYFLIFSPDNKINKLIQRFSDIFYFLIFHFPRIGKRIGTHNTFYIYSAICMIGLLFVWAKVKETKGKTLEELEFTMQGALIVSILNKN